MKRFLEPHFLIRVGSRLWMLDRVQPVAAVLDPSTGQIEHVIDWRQLPVPYAGTSEVRCAGDSRSVWLQYGVSSPVVRIGPSGLEHGVDVGTFLLHEADDHGAWCASGHDPSTGPQDETDQSPDPAQPDGILLIPPAGEPQLISINRPVRALTARTDGLYVDVDSAPSSSTARNWRHETLRVAWDAPLPDRIDVDSCRVVTPTPGPALRWSNGGQPGPAGWHSPDLAILGGLPVGGLRWEMGWDRGSPRVQRLAVATGHDPDTGAERLRAELGAGTVIAAAEAAERLWVVVDRSRLIFDFDRSRFLPSELPGAELLAIDPRSSAVTIVLPGHSMDISDRCWPLIAQPAGASDHVESWRERLSGLQGMAGITDSSTTVSGQWPDVVLTVRFRHPYFPGGIMMRRYRLFDELGRPNDLGDYPEVFLQEDLATGLLPPIQLATDGVLEI